MKIGVDITSISRFKQLTPGFEKRFCHIDELKRLETQVDKAHYLASLWAIKEALFKADNSLCFFDQINIQKNNGVWVYKDWKILTSNEQDLVVAFVATDKE
ncbi:Holo-[acyl-carrier protein]synthase [Mycoplasmopsis bovigenitalium]|uniref:Holo-[acyl-carrier protein]synthase n=1 Tax=Mycoplasmopsis bovigenitalium TaxID=2112 RepID=A0A449A9Z5_9BACT|nr:4'-phosphopantetheinyl transferase superfamily protein [Mycoplasmopsis bovigenitalium]VEU61097.1 Holo-[acyl-carrier protein]synthase [Mycoplasmopsis bovigenitalium]